MHKAWPGAVTPSLGWESLAASKALSKSPQGHQHTPWDEEQAQTSGSPSWIPRNTAQPLDDQEHRDFPSL